MAGRGILYVRTSEGFKFGLNFEEVYAVLRRI